jgi:RecJ-like exonuclease
MTKRFELHWNEIPENLREQKIDEFLAEEYFACEECDGTGTIEVKPGPNDMAPTDEGGKECPACKGEGAIAGDPENLYHRDEAEEIIQSHFPIYF